MIEMPILKLELQGFRQQMAHAFADYQGEMSRYVNDRIEHVLSESNFKYVVDKTIEDAIQKALDDAVKSYFKYGPGWKSIQDVVNEALGKQTIKLENI